MCSSDLTMYTLEKNGFVERKNRTIVEVARAIVYVQNRCPHSTLDSKTPEEVFFGKKPDVSHLRVFVSPVYFHVPKEKRSKLDASRKKGIFVGCSETSKAYKIYVPGQREVEICHDVTFDEDDTLKKVRNIPSSKEEKEDEEAGKQEEPKDDMMLDVEGTMDQGYSRRCRETYFPKGDIP